MENYPFFRTVTFAYQNCLLTYYIHADGTANFYCYLSDRDSDILPDITIPEKMSLWKIRGIDECYPYSHKELADKLRYEIEKELCKRGMVWLSHPTKPFMQ